MKAQNREIEKGYAEIEERRRWVWMKSKGKAENRDGMCVGKGEMEQI